MLDGYNCIIIAWFYAKVESIGTTHGVCTLLNCTGNGRDFIILNQDLTITATSNGSRGCFNITIIDDSTIEDTESFQVSLTSTSDDVAVANSLATIWITDNDGRYGSYSEVLFGYNPIGQFIIHDYARICTVALTTP